MDNKISNNVLFKYMYKQLFLVKTALGTSSRLTFCLSNYIDVGVFKYHLYTLVCTMSLEVCQLILILKHIPKMRIGFRFGEKGQANIIVTVLLKPS